jgi:hypothetical protein
VPHSIIGKIVATPPAKMTYLDNRDLAGLSVHRTNPFRDIYNAANVARSQEASSVCNTGVNVETEAIARAGQRSCTTSAAHVPESRER